MALTEFHRQELNTMICRMSMALRRIQAITTAPPGEVPDPIAAIATIAAEGFDPNTPLWPDRSQGDQAPA